MKRNRGFTLMEMLIVVAIVAVLAAIAIPVFSGSLHKAKVAADMANVRAYYAESQTQIMLTGESSFGHWQYFDKLTFADGSVVPLQAGWAAVLLKRENDTDDGTPLYFQVVYTCSKGDCVLELGLDN